MRLPVFSAVPFRSQPQRDDGVVLYGDGLKHLEEAYAPLRPGAAAGAVDSVQIWDGSAARSNTTADYKGLKMRIPGSAARSWPRRAGRSSSRRRRDLHGARARHHRLLRNGSGPPTT